MRILITGVAGFLGSHLSERLLSQGHHVIGLDDLSTGSLMNIEKQLQNANFVFHKHDVREFIDFESDYILNFACPASPKHYQNDPVKTIETNFLGIINMLRLAKRYNAKLLQASTSEIYGDPIVSPQKEDYWGNVNPIGIRSCYDEGKRAAETLCFDYKRQYSMDIRIIRIFNTYGPNMAVDDGRVISNFITQALRNEDITIYGDGNQTRSFCYVSDLIDGILKVMNLKSPLESPINLGNPKEFTVLELARNIISKINTKSRLIKLELPSDDPKQRKPDISLANELLAWSPKISLDMGLDLTIKYFTEMLKFG
jgi:UDP-glucuronate decarboxylase